MQYNNLLFNTMDIVDYNKTTTDNIINHYKVNVNINSLQKEVKQRELRKLETYEKVLALCYQKILSTNKNSNNCCCIFTCPQFIYGFPLFNINECIIYIMTKLTEKKFNVHLALPNNIFISWKINNTNTSSNKLLEYLPINNNYINQSNNISINHSNNNSNNNFNTSKHSNILSSNKNNTNKQYKPIDDYEYFDDFNNY